MQRIPSASYRVAVDLVRRRTARLQAAYEDVRPPVNPAMDESRLPAQLVGLSFGALSLFLQQVADDDPGPFFGQHPGPEQLPGGGSLAGSTGEYLFKGRLLEFRGDDEELDLDAVGVPDV